MDSAGVVDEFEFENACRNAVEVQRDLLHEILQKNSNSCEYLQRYGSPLDHKSFKSQVPVVSYDQIWPDIQRVANGCTQPILCTDPIIHFGQSSGTSSGKHKIIPQTLAGFSVQTRTIRAAFAYTRKYFPLESREALSMTFAYCGQQHRTKSGLLLGAPSTNVYKSEVFKQGSRTHTSPWQVVVAASDWRQTSYCHLLCGLLKRHKVEILDSLFAYTLVEAMRMLQKEWKNLCQDISTGTLSSSVTDADLRRIMSDFLQQELHNRDSEELAEEISIICSKLQSWQGIIPLLWPRAKYVHTVVTGAMEPYVPALKRYAGDLPLVGFSYSSCETSIMGVVTNPAVPPEKVLFTLSPFSVFFEFIPVDGDEDSIVDFEGVEAGKEYEIVITNSQGLYRYKLGDVVKVVGFHHEAPQVAFDYRKSAILSLTAEKIDEQELQKAVVSSSPVDVEVADFTSYADFESEEPPHCVIFCELKDAEDYSKHEALCEFAGKIDRSFDNVLYLKARVNKTIGPLEVVLVKQGAFEKLMERAVQSGAAPGQYKTPRCVATSEMLQLLKEEKIGRSYRSASEVPASVAKANLNKLIF